jgi:hypothetical protein
VSYSHRPNAAGPRHPIADKVALTKLVNELAQKAGGVVALSRYTPNSRATPISRATWNRLIRGKHSAISHQLASCLQRIILVNMGDRGNRRFLAAMTHRGTPRTMRRYWRWGFERRYRLWERRGPFWERDGHGSITEVRGRAERRRARMKYADALQHEVRKEVPEFVKLLKWMQRQYIDNDRFKVVQMRILEPFLEAPESGFIELSWEELTEASRREYVREAVRREKWFLDVRGPAQQRAEALAAMDLGVRTAASPESGPQTRRKRSVG